MDTKGNSRKCSGCRYYRAFYTKGASAFYRERTGYCLLKQNVVLAKEFCDCYKYREKKDRTVTSEHLEGTANDIKALESFFGDDSG